MRYGKESEPVFKRLGGSIVWRGDMLIGLIGPADEKWDICFIAEYPTVEIVCINAKRQDLSKGRGTQTNCSKNLKTN